MYIVISKALQKTTQKLTLAKFGAILRRNMGNERNLKGTGDQVIYTLHSRIEFLRGQAALARNLVKETKKATNQARADLWEDEVTTEIDELREARLPTSTSVYKVKGAFSSNPRGRV